jgi:hypothetical protein
MAAGRLEKNGFSSELAKTTTILLLHSVGDATSLEK